MADESAKMSDCHRKICVVFRMFAVILGVILGFGGLPLLARPKLIEYHGVEEKLLQGIETEKQNSEQLLSRSYLFNT